ncbi:MAG: glycosyltransferase WbuB [Gemmatimonadales bacterium]|nr:MAG: glycosyltransferase WbuB [Gemmatimonadales bacterium]
MRVLYFHQYFTTPSGAGGTRSYEFARRLVERGHRVTMVTGRSDRAGSTVREEVASRPTRGAVDGIDVIELPLPYSNQMGLVRRSAVFASYALRSARVALTEPHDLVFATSTPLTAGVPGILARWLRGKPFVFEVRDLWPELPRAMGVVKNPLVLWGMSALEWATYRSAHHTVGLSPGIRSGIERRGVPPELISYVPNGCDLDRFGSGVVPWRPEGVATGQLLAVFAGAHGMANGLDAVLDAAAELRSRKVDGVTLLLVGSGMLKPGLMERARSEGLDNVRFLDPIPKSQVARLLAGSDIGMQILANIPAFYDGTSPNKFFDYLASGLPVLNNYPGWLASLIEERDCGFTVPPEDPVAFADALEEAARDRNALARKGVAARELGEAMFDRAELSDRFVDLLEGVFAANHPGANGR